MRGFQNFLLRGNVVDLAVAVVIGVAFGAVVTALVKDIITPIIGIAGGLPDFSAWVLTIGASKFFIGDFINSVVSFVIIAAVIYFLVVVPTSKLIERMKSETPPSATLTRECPECLSKIPVKARRCAFCTTEIDSSAEMLNATNSSALSQPTTRG
jgi:large conductance mechanosensitive channel